MSRFEISEVVFALYLRWPSAFAICIESVHKLQSQLATLFESLATGKCTTEGSSHDIRSELRNAEVLFLLVNSILEGIGDETPLASDTTSTTGFMSASSLSKGSLPRASIGSTGRGVVIQWALATSNLIQIVGHGGDMLTDKCPLLATSVLSMVSLFPSILSAAGLLFEISAKLCCYL